MRADLTHLLLVGAISVGSNDGGYDDDNKGCAITGNE